jgi:NTE family protein
LLGHAGGDAMNPKIGVALGSGGARGWAHIGVLHALEEAGLSPDIVCGTSIGAVIGALNLVGALADFAQFVRRMNRIRLSQYFDFKFSAGGIIAGKRVLQVLEPIFGRTTIEDLPRRFGCVATDLATGDEVWLREGRLIDALRASYSIPGLFPPVEIGGRWLLDGALVNPLPISLCRALGAELILAIDVNAGILAPMRFDAEGLRLTERRGIAGGIGGIGGFVRGYFGRRKGGPSTFGVLTRTFQIAQMRLSRIRLEQDPADIVLRPEVGRIGPLEFYRAGECIAAGEAAVRKALPAINQALRAPRTAQARRGA